MAKALIIVHAPPEASDCRALTASRLAGAMLADNKDVELFLVEDGVRLADPRLSEDNSCRALLYELLNVGLKVQVCGGMLRKLGWEDGYLLPGVTRSSMKGLSAMISEADEIVSF
jgi:uncharacterized protein involved in oxidation of intracellular sulfur